MQENEQIKAAKKADNPTTVIRMQSGFVVMSQAQFLPGYCLLLAYPQVSALNDLPLPKRNAFLADMGLLGEAIEKVCGSARINYAILGNQDPFLHAHVIPRYHWEPAELRPLSIWRYPDAVWTDQQSCFSVEEHGQVRDAIRQKLQELMRDQ